MTREDKIKAIYEKIADKTLSFGCKLSTGYEIVVFYEITSNLEYVITNFGKFNYGEVKIIGHPVMIGDVLDWMDSSNSVKEWGRDYIDGLVGFLSTRKDKRKSIDAQENECVDFIYSLIE